MKTPKTFYVVMDKDGRLWAGYNSFTTRPWQAKFYSVKEQADKTAERCRRSGTCDVKVAKAKIEIEFLDIGE